MAPDFDGGGDLYPGMGSRVCILDPVAGRKTFDNENHPVTDPIH